MTVAPLMGAWIETIKVEPGRRPDIGVAPLMGAWIETASIM